MAYSIKKNTTVFIEPEVTQGLYVAPTGTGSGIMVLADGFELNPSAEMLDRNVFVSTIDNPDSKVGIKAASGTIPVELRAGVSNAVPEWGLLAQSALGGLHTRASVTNSTTSNTSSVLNVASTTGFNIGDIVLVTDASYYHVSPIKAIVTNTSIELELAAGGAFADGAVIQKSHNYYAASSGHPSFSLTKYVESAVTEYSAGCMCNSMALEGWTTGGYASLNFGFDGMSYSRSVAAPTYAPAPDTTLPPVILSACIWQDFSPLAINELSISVENTVGQIKSTCSSNGIISTRATNRTITGTINPYKLTDSVAQFTKFTAGTTFSLFGYAYNPGTGIIKSDVVAFFLPHCQITELAEADLDGVLQDQLSFRATSGSSGTGVAMYLASF